MSYDSAYPEFSWSNSRDKLFDDCARAYYYKYYGAHRGWRDDVDDDTKDVYRLKNALSLPVALSRGVGESIRGYFRGKITQDKFKGNIIGVLHTICARALNQKACMIDPKGNPSLIELINYDGGFHNDYVSEVIEKIKAKIDSIAVNFFNAPTTKELKSGKEGTVLLENFAGFDYGSYKAKMGEGTFDVWSKPDIVHKVGNKLVMTVWKTGVEDDWMGRAEKERFHAQVIAIYGWKRYKVKMPFIEVRMTNLISGITDSYTIESKEEYKEACKRIEKSITKMSKMVVDGDIVRNKPLSMDKFEQKPRRKICNNCPFLSVCTQESAGEQNVG